MLIRRLDDCSACTAGDHTRLRELLHPDRQSAAIRYSLAHASLDPGMTSLPHALSSSEVYYILSGRGCMVIDGEECEVETGQAVYIPPGAVQHIRNTGNEPLAFLCIVDPAWQRADETVLIEKAPVIPTETADTIDTHAEKNT